MSPSFSPSASTTAAGNRTARLFPHFETCMGHRLDIHRVMSISKLHDDCNRDSGCSKRASVHPHFDITSEVRSPLGHGPGSAWPTDNTSPMSSYQRRLGLRLRYSVVVDYELPCSLIQMQFIEGATIMFVP